MSIRRWGHALVGAYLVLVGAIWLNWGVAAFMGVAAAIVVIFPSLDRLASILGIAKGSRWSERSLGRALRRPRTLVAFTLALAIADVVLLAKFGIRWRRDSLRFSLAGQVVTPTGAVADGVVVTMRVGGKTYTAAAANGRFTFDGVNAGDSRDGKCLLIARGPFGSSSVELPTTTQEILVRLENRDPPFRVRYKSIGGYAIDLLLGGDVQGALKRQLAGEPMVVRNSVYATLFDLARRFSVPLQESHVWGPEDDDSTSETLAAKLRGRPSFAGSTPSQRTRELNNEELDDLLKGSTRWHAVPRGLSPAWQPTAIEPWISRFVFWRFADSQDLAQPPGPVQDPWLAFHRYLLSGASAPGFAIAALHQEACGGGMLMQDVLARAMVLRVMILEPAGHEAIRMGRWTLRQDGETALRPRGRGDEAGWTASSANLIPAGLLRPTESVLVPLELSLPFDRGAGLLKVIGEPSDPTAVESAVAALERAGRDLDVPWHADFHNVLRAQLSWRGLIQKLREPPADAGVDWDFAFGPAVSVAEVEVDGVVYPVRKSDPTLVVLLGGSAEGSCPIAYSLDSRTGAWNREGSILYGAVGAERYGTYSKKLSTFAGKIRLREEEHEVTYLDEAHITLTKRGTIVRELATSERRLRAADRRYVTLRRGDAIDLDFESPAVSWDTAWLIATGYYTTEVARGPGVAPVGRHQ